MYKMELGKNLDNEFVEHRSEHELSDDLSIISSIDLWNKLSNNIWNYLSDNISVYKQTNIKKGLKKEIK
jgi:hypothetical protein